MKILHVEEHGVSLEEVHEVTRFHAKILHPKFSAISVILSYIFSWNVDVHCELMLYLTVMKETLIPRLYLFPSNPGQILAVEQQESKFQGSKRFPNTRPEQSFKLNSSFRLNIPCSTSIFPPRIHLIHRDTTPSFFKAVVKMTGIDIEMELFSDDERTVWKETVSRDEYYQNQGKTQMQTVQVTLFIVTGAGKDRSRQAEVSNPERVQKVPIGRWGQGQAEWSGRRAQRQDRQSGQAGGLRGRTGRVVRQAGSESGQAEWSGRWGQGQAEWSGRRAQRQDRQSGQAGGLRVRTGRVVRQAGSEAGQAEWSGRRAQRQDRQSGQAGGLRGRTRRVVRQAGSESGQARVKTGRTGKERLGEKHELRHNAG
uniref:FIIND domain-containing protein n=1 Tax=Salmo trutta TaxID=8032 RepID=A0A674BHT8_SALTR